MPLLSRQAQREISDNWLRLQVHETLDPQAALLLAGFGVKKVRFFSPSRGHSVEAYCDSCGDERLTRQLNYKTQSTNRMLSQVCKFTFNCISMSY